MDKAERRMMEPVTGVSLEKTQQAFQKMFFKMGAKFQAVWYNAGLLYIFIGFLLGRAVILTEILPFALPYFGVLMLIKKDKALVGAAALLAGGATVSLETSAFIGANLLMFFICHKLFSYFIKEQLKILPLLIFLSVLTSRLAFSYVIDGAITPYNSLMAGVESGLSFILTLIFLQSLPLMSANKYKQTLKVEEIICLMILIASAMTGFVGVSYMHFQAEHVFSRYAVLLFAFIAGSSIGCTVGVVTGLILSLANVGNLYQMSLLAFSGLLGGLLKEGKKVGAAIGLVVGSMLLSLYGEGSADLMTTLGESLIAIVLFFLTPKKVTSSLSKHIPGTNEHAQEQQLYARKIRDVTANRVDQFSKVFLALSESFASFYEKSEEGGQEQEIDLFLSSITEKSCQNCYKKERCWVQNFNATYDLMSEMTSETMKGKYQTNRKLKKEFQQHCSKPKIVEEAIEQEINVFKANLKLKEQVQESRKLVAEQLLGVSQVMDDFSKEIKRERENHFHQEEQILDALQNFGVSITNVDIYSLEQGNIDIEMSIPYCQGHGECEKIIAPMLSDILEEPIIVKREECAMYPNGFCHVSLGSSKTYKVETGAAHAAKGGGLVSGDSYSMIDLGVGKYAIAISDGMGNGVRAHFESNETIKLLEKILQSGIDEKVAIKTVNSILSLRTTEEMFSTLDLAIVDLQDAHCKFLKIGSTPSFVKRGERVMKVQASNLPMGIIDELEVDIVGEQMKAGDLLIMMSDGIFEGPKHVENHDIWMKRKISELETTDPQEVADLIMEEVIRTRAGKIEDDMTIVVARIDHNTPKWSSIPSSRYYKKESIVS
ncbi:stage II sporulation protein E [Metabacillus sp. GX 13764]|uniref:stage II sporulation protein E n=1 Tax=Metabacillus kandeliae TaxID=2900151 RepID=UPI001E522F3A|nr:stage II sporulation protein E [Metabacillus kandeliae]MCD7036658.1 stage II sporulation protein E [Metabacillus kandeliae]